MRAQIVKLSNAGEEVMEDEFVNDEEWAMDMYVDYILNDPEMDDYVKEEYTAYATGEDERGREKRIGWLVKNGKISETSLTGKYSLYLYIIEEDDREIDEYYTESGEVGVTLRGVLYVMDNQENKKMVDVVCKCPWCGEKNIVTMNRLDWYRGGKSYDHGDLIQNAFPKQTADEREMLKTGICDPCWKGMKGDDDEEYDESDLFNEARDLTNKEIIMYAVEPDIRRKVADLYNDVVRGYPPEAYDQLVDLLGDKADDLQENLEFLLRDREAEQNRAATISDWYARSARSGSNMGD